MTAERVPLGGSDAGADYVGAVALASIKLERAAIGGYDMAQVEDLRRRALNTIAYLESQVEDLRVQLSSLQSALESGLGPANLGRGMAFLARALRGSFDDGQVVERYWAAEEIGLIVAGDEKSSLEHAAAFPAKLAEVVGDRPQDQASAPPTSELVGKLLGQDVTGSSLADSPY
jgi:hypothetical protein